MPVHPPRTLFRFALQAAIAIGAVLSGGCVLFRPHVSDLAFASLEPPAVAPSGATSQYHERFRLRFTTKRNLIELYSGVGTYLQMSLCPYTDYPFITMSDIYYRGQSLTALSLAPQPPELVGDGPFEYEAFLRYVDQLTPDEAGHTLLSVPLPTEPQDLCFIVFGGSYMGMGGFDSNVAVIPKEALVRALASTHRGN